jgi:ABC-2 type transport system ATP-binding protein
MHIGIGIGAVDPRLLLLLIPLAVIQVGLLLFAIVDLFREDRRVRGGSKALWAVVIVFVNLLGPILYFLVGREDGPAEPPAPGPGAMPGWGSPHDPPLVGAAGSSPAAQPAVPADEPLAVPPPAPATSPAPVAPPAPTESPRPQRAPLPAGAPPAIRVEGLTKRYPTGVLGLDRLTMEVPTGSVFGLLGPNGAGKTTCLRLLAGLTRPSAGVAIVGGRDVAANELAVRRDLGYLEQDPRAYGWMTGREQVRFLGRLHGLRDDALEAATTVAIGRAGLADAADRRASTYSGGMRQRLGIAGALVHAPAIIVLDEPVSSLDPEGRRDVLELIADLRGSTTVLFSTHVLADVERICDRVGILAHGRLLVEGPLDELLDRYALPVWRIEPEPGQADAVERLAGALRGRPWVTEAAVDHGLLTVAVSDPDAAAHEILGAVAAEGLAVISAARARPTLEDVFLRLTAESGAGEAAA